MKPTPKKTSSAGKPKRAATAAVAANDPAAVDALLRALKHPLKAEIEAVRAIIAQADPRLRERVKWNAPSFFHAPDGRDVAAFNLHQEKFVQLVFVFHGGKMIADRHDLLEGAYKDRRLASFHSMADVQAKRTALAAVVRTWVALHRA